MTIAQTILAQLGGGVFCMMTGAKEMVASETALRIKIGRFAGVKTTHVKVTLDPCDTYTIETMRWNGRKLEMQAIDKMSGVYCTDLRRAFTSMTGLDTSL
jgi:uncharacterized lipoprotein YehR (DUF1307 family)